MSDNALKKIYNVIYEDLKVTKEYRNMLEKADYEYNRVAETLSQEQLENFEKFDDATFDLSAETARMYFEYGFKLGLRLSAECFICDETAEN